MDGWADAPTDDRTDRQTDRQTDRPTMDRPDHLPIEDSKNYTFFSLIYSVDSSKNHSNNRIKGKAAECRISNIDHSFRIDSFAPIMDFSRKNSHKKKETKT